MRIGILSDTHGKLAATAAAVRLLRAHNAEFMVHCGDVGDAGVLGELAGTPAAFVWGNCDFDRLGLQVVGQKLSIQCLGPYGELALDGRKLAVLHGDDARLKARLLAEQSHDYLLQGHTHIRADERVGRLRIINPGALHRTADRTVAVLDTAADTVCFLRVDAPGR